MSLRRAADADWHWEFGPAESAIRQMVDEPDMRAVGQEDMRKYGCRTRFENGAEDTVRDFGNLMRP